MKKLFFFIICFSCLAFTQSFDYLPAPVRSFVCSFDKDLSLTYQTLQSMNPTQMTNAHNEFLWDDYEGFTAFSKTFYGIITGASIGRTISQLDPILFKETAVKPREFEYAAKIICGEQKDPENTRLAKGLYATTINIHNPNDSTVLFYKKLALTYPPEEQRAGKIIPLGVDTLSYDQALKVDCIDIKKHFNFSDYIEGFVIIQSTGSLDVSAVYTASRSKTFLFWSSYEVVSVDVEQIRERKRTMTLPPPPPQNFGTLDHFKIYKVDTVGVDLEVRLTDQFDDQPKDVRVLTLTHFANPTRKVYEGVQTDINDSNSHFNMYAIKQNQTEPRRTIRFLNQFGQYSVEIQDPRFLLVPAQKTSDDGSVFPDSLDHYKCYEVIGITKIPDLPIVSLEDQFGSEKNVQVLKPRFFCVPVQKELTGVPPHKIINANNYLVIYNILPNPYNLQISVKDQFEELPLRVTKSVMLAVPSKEQAVGD